MDLALTAEALTVPELADFLSFLSTPTLKLLGGLPAAAQLLREEETRGWAIPPNQLVIAVELRVLRNYPSRQAQTNVALLAGFLLAVLGSPTSCTRGHLFSALRLMGHYFRANEDSTMISAEYISINPDDLIPVPMRASTSAPLLGLPAPAPKKRRFSEGAFEKPELRLLVTDERLTELDRLIDNCNPSLTAYTQPKEWLQLPFPFIYHDLPTHRFSYTFQESASIPTFTFMPREFLATVYERLVSLGNGQSSLYLHGTMGLGKSHILAALAILLRRQGNRVVFLPDCGQLVSDPAGYAKSALLCAFSVVSGDEPEARQARETLRKLENPEEIRNWSYGFLQGKKVFFIVDQLNALETGDGKGVNDDDAKRFAKRFLVGLYMGHVCLRSSSPNDPEQFKRIRPNELLVFRDGLTASERDSWLNYHHANIPVMTKAELDFFFDYTGGIPLLLSPLEGHGDKPFEEVWPDISNHPMMASIKADLHRFPTKFNQQEKELYYDGLAACLTGETIIDINPRYIDHRFFFELEAVGGVTCGLARRESFDILRAHRQQLPLSTNWLNSFALMVSNRVVVGFMVEHSVLEVVAAAGLTGPDNFMRWGAVDMILRFPDRDMASLLQKLPDDVLTKPGQRSLLCLPHASNFPDIDGLFININNGLGAGGGGLQVKIIPIQISIARVHKPSHQLFYAKWDRWVKWFDGYTITTAFLWISEDGPWSVITVPATTHTSRARQGEQLSPNYQKYTIPIEQAAPMVAQALRQAQNSIL
ncbi:hypothetical protein C8J57DRAFT_1490408 [Mycena rebaudengoi]|nr:hypothetical protein C8J57DRAFT_1490408 [Mycena rebaudengoi]